MLELKAEKIMRPSIIIIGAGGHAVSIANVAHGSGMSVIAFVDDDKAGTNLLDIPVISTQRCINEHRTANLTIAIGDNAVRERVSNEYKSVMPNAKFPALIHNSTVIGINTKVGDGTVVMPQVNIGPNCTVRQFCILNTSSSIDHDCEMDAFSSIAPRVVTGGNVKIGLGSAVSIGATINHGVIIGDDVVIGANSYVNKKVESNVVAYGSPCKYVRKRSKGDSYFA